MSLANIMYVHRVKWILIFIEKLYAKIAQNTKQDKARPSKTRQDEEAPRHAGVAWF